MRPKPNFDVLAREWMVTAQGHSRPEHEKSLGALLARIFDLGEVNAASRRDFVARGLDGNPLPAPTDLGADGGGHTPQGG